MNNFNYESKYETYMECEIVKGRYYENNNLCLSLFNYELGPITKITVNTDIKLPDDRIAIKDYSENAGMVDWLVKNNLIEKEPIRHILQGYVEIPVHKLTDYAKNLLGISK